MKPEAKHLSLGCNESEKDSRTVIHSADQAGVPYIKGGYSYLPNDIENQLKVGICTAISTVQNQEKANGKKYSADFQYLLQKKFYDMNWDEGSSLLSALKVANNYGFLPANLWTFTTDADRQAGYAIYVAKLQAITDAQIQTLLSQCIDKIAGYAAVDVTDPQKIAAAIMESKAGILCRYTTGPEWWTGKNGQISWSPIDIDPIQAPQFGEATGGHAITDAAFDFTVNIDLLHANTWGPEWDINGTCNINWNNYKMTEAWVILNTAPTIPPFQFLHDLQQGMISPDVQQLQIVLNKNHITQVATDGSGSPGHETKVFGPLTYKAVVNFQNLYGITPAVGYVGIKTRSILNSLINN